MLIYEYCIVFFVVFFLHESSTTDSFLCVYVLMCVCTDCVCTAHVCALILHMCTCGLAMDENISLREARTIV